jgi:hypothetical protein
MRRDVRFALTDFKMGHLKLLFLVVAAATHVAAQASLYGQASVNRPQRLSQR